jgi:hypothetical protein
VPRRGRALCVALLSLAFAATSWTGSRAAQPDSPVCDIRTSERIVAIGDIHGAYDRFVEILQAAGLIDKRLRWTGKRAHLVQLGDILHRGSDSRRTLDLLRRLERDATRAGGRVHVLLGNHEVMHLMSDWRYVSEGEYAAFRNAGSEELRERAYTMFARQEAERAKQEDRPHDEKAFRERFMKEVPLGFLEMRLAFDAKGEYGRWLRERPALVRINGIVFVHGGISEEVAALGCEGINEAFRREITGPPPAPATEQEQPEQLSTSERGPFWYRGLAQEPEDEFRPTLDVILARMGARAIVVGHTVAPGRIAARFGGRVALIDSGMLGGDFYPGGVAAALEINGDVLTAIYPDRRERIAVLEPLMKQGPGRVSSNGSPARTPAAVGIWHGVTAR